MKLNQIEALKKQGYKIKITHYRYTTDGRMRPRRRIDEINKSKYAHIPLVIEPCGGTVEAEVETSEGIRVVGRSYCSLLDNFNRKIGTKMAFGRAMKEIGELARAKEVARAEEAALEVVDAS